MTGSFFGSGFRPFGLPLRPQMGLTLKMAEEWWKTRLPEYKAATGAGIPQTPSAPSGPYRPPPPSSGPSPLLLVGGALLLGGAVVAAIVFSRSRPPTRRKA